MRENVQRDQELDVPAGVSGTARGRRVEDLLGAAGNTAVTRLIGELGSGSPLPAGTVEVFGAAYNTSLAQVRAHVDSPVPERHGVGALTVGDHIAFAPGRFAPETEAGQRLIGHELAHVVQQQSGSGVGSADDTHEREADAAAGAALAGTRVGSLSGAPAFAVQGDGGPVPLLASGGSVDERVAAFRSLVQTTAVQRLIANQSNLTQWSHLVDSVIPSGDMAAMGLAQNGGAPALFELQGMQDPMMRELRASQAMGRNRACTGCHIENYAWGTRGDRAAGGGQEWLSPNEQRASGGGYHPAAGTAEGRLNQLFPNPGAVNGEIERMRPVLHALGPDGYRVLPASILAQLETGSVESLRSGVRAAISERGAAYGELISRIQAGQMGYEHFGPIIRDLLPAADAEVRTAVQSEMDTQAAWDRAEAAVVGVLSVIALLLTIFPPTSAGGLLAMGALEVGLGAYGGAQGARMMEVGSAYSLGTGANDVLSRQQQDAGPEMVLGGFVNVVLAPLAVAGGTGRMSAAATRMADESLLTLAVGQTAQRGNYVMTVAPDGSLMVTLTDQPDVFIVVRDGRATSYHVGPAGIHPVETQQVLPPGAGPPTGAGGAGGAGSSPWPHVPQRAPNWCGAAAGEMSAGRLGVEVGQEEIAASRWFEPATVIDGREIRAGGFQTGDLGKAMEEIAPVAERRWVAGNIPHEMRTPEQVVDVMRGFLGSSRASIILRVQGGKHWIVVDEVTAAGMIAIRDPAAAVSQVVSPQDLLNMYPTGEAVFSFPQRK